MQYTCQLLFCLLLKYRSFFFYCYNRCPCGPEDFDPKVVRNAIRRCEGNFESGAEWGLVNDNECSEFGATARMLCNLALVCIYTLMYV